MGVNWKKPSSPCASFLPFSYLLKTETKPLLIPSPQDIDNDSRDEQVWSRHSFVVHTQSLALGKENTLWCFPEHVFRASEEQDIQKHMACNFPSSIHNLQQDQL